jgi:hypothetical protein
LIDPQPDLIVRGEAGDRRTCARGRPQAQGISLEANSSR